MVRYVLCENRYMVRYIVRWHEMLTLLSEHLADFKCHSLVKMQEEVEELQIS